MRVCYFGPYAPENPRDRVIIDGLRKNGVEVVECNARSANRILDYTNLLLKHQKLDYDVIMLGSRGQYYGQPLVPIMRLISKKPMVFDANISIYETSLDRNLVNRESIEANLYYLLDYKALQNADLVLTVTKTYIKYYSELYDADPDKFRRLFVGADDQLFYPKASHHSNDFFRVMFWGGYIPLQGVQHVIRAAKMVEFDKDIRFELIGQGQTYPEVSELSRSLGVSNVIFRGWMPYDQIPDYVAKADVSLGIFGETEKAQRVIPAKAYEALAMRKPLITGDSPAARELLKDMESCILVPMGDPKAIADAVLFLKGDEELREKIAGNGYELFKERLTPKAVGKELKSILLNLLDNCQK